MGVSGGSISNMILTLYGKPIHNAVATSAGLGVPITIAGTIGLMIAGLPQQALMPPLSIGFVSLIGLALMAPVSSFTAPYGALLAHRLPSGSSRSVRLFSALGRGASVELVLSPRLSRGRGNVRSRASMTIIRSGSRLRAISASHARLSGTRPCRYATGSIRNGEHG